MSLVSILLLYVNKPTEVTFQKQACVAPRCDTAVLTKYHNEGFYGLSICSLLPL
jgi:hypothetical protein